MSLWEYKHITSGPHGFATPALLESYLNQLGKDEWEIISYQTLPANALAFNGVARRTTLRDWTLESAAAAAAKVEADKLRAEFAAKFQGNATPAAGAEGAEKPTSLVADTAAPEDGFRKLRDTERDADPDAHEGEDWDEWDNYDDDLPTFFEAIKPHLRKNQRGPGQSVGVTFLAKRWEQTEGDLIGALKECGFVVPESEDTPPDHLEFEGDLYWLNLNNRHELFLNTREKPRPVYRIAQAKKLDPSDPAFGLLAEEAAAEQAQKLKQETERLAREAEQAARRAEHEARRAAAQAAREASQAAAKAAAELAKANAANAPASANAQGETDAAASAVQTSVASANGSAATAKEGAPAAPLPEGEEFLSAVRQQMRRNRRGPGYSGSTVYLARAFKQSEADLVTAFAALGLHVPESANDKPVKTTLGDYVYWLNKDSRGGIWINGDEAREQAKSNAATQPPEGGEPKSESTTASTEVASQAANDAAAVTQSAGENSTQGNLALGVAEPAPSTEPASAAPAESSASTPTPAAQADGPRDPSLSAQTQPASSAPAHVKSSAANPVAGDSALTAIRLLLNPNKRGTGVSAEVGHLARSLNRDLQDFLVALTDLGLALPETAEHKPSFVEHGDEIFWLNKNPKDGSVWVNAKASKASATKKPTAAAAKPRAKRAAKDA